MKDLISRHSVADGDAMLRNLVDRAHRTALRGLYPLLCRWERLSGRRARVSLVAVWHRNRLLVVRHSYRPGSALPGGDARRGESSLQTAVRELGEEVGITVVPERLVPLGLTGGRWTVYEYRPQDEPHIRVDNREVIAAAFCDPAEIPEPTPSLRHYLRAASRRAAA